MKKLSLSFLILAILATALPALAGDVITVQKEKATAEPTEDAAVVYVVRPAMMGKAVKIWAFAGESPIGANKGKHYTFATVPPGKHVFWARAENVSALEMEVEAGKTYYLKQGVRMGGMKARVKLMVVDETEGEEAIKKCKYTQLTGEGEARAAEIIAAKYKTAVEKAKEREAE